MSTRSALAVALLIACGRSGACRPSATSVTATAAPASTPSTAAPAAVSVAWFDAAAASEMSAAWPALVQDERWEEAWRALEALSDSEKSRPQVRYARARVALARQDAAAALPLLNGLEGALPLLAEGIQRSRAEAQLAVGPFAEAGEWFLARPTPEAQLNAARAFERAKDVGSARTAAERVLAGGKRTRSQEAEARALRVRLADPPGNIERSDARWLATYGADVAQVDTLALLARLDPKRALTAQELMVRARVLSEAGRTDDALHAIDLAASAPSSASVTRLDLERARGAALFRAHGRGNDAAKVLAQCARAGGPHAAEDAFHAARALSRADRDEEAIRGYEEVERRFPKSTWAEDAAFFVPYLHMLHAEWRACTSGFDVYVRAYARGTHERDARRDNGLCRLLGGDAKAARSLFERLSSDAGADPLASARMGDMAALSAFRDGDHAHAIALWTDLARSPPLSWAALVARTHLAEAGAPMPLAIEAAPPSADVAPLQVLLPPPADLLHGMGLDAEAEAELHDREGAIAMAAGSRASEALCIAYGELNRARRRYQIAQTLPSALFAAAPDARTRWAWDCAFASPYAREVQAAEAGEGLPPGLLWAVMRQESGFDPEAVSPARAIGLMQLLPETARTLEEELSFAHEEARLTSPPFAIRAGARLLHKLLDRFKGSVPLAVAGYNCGAESVERWLSRAPGMQLDTFIERIPFDETREYVGRVMGNFAHYAYLARGDQGVPRLELELKIP